MLPRVIPLLERLRDSFVSLRSARAIEATRRRASVADGHPVALPKATNEEDQALQQETLQECTALLTEWGIQLKDPERGLIDFPHEREGVVVLLCYQLGESELKYWHPIETGYAGRQPI